MKKYITIPAAIVLRDKLTGEMGQAVSFKDFVTVSLLSDARFGGTYENLKAAMAIDAALSESNGHAALDLKSWEKLKQAAEAPSEGNYPGFRNLGMIQLMPFIEAIIGASDHLTKE